MNNTNDKTNAELLRIQAEELLKSKKRETGTPSSEIDALKLVHELEVHQIELEMMNAQLSENAEKEKVISADLVIANKKLLFQNSEKEARAAELVIANKELLFQNFEKEARAAELLITHEELNRAHLREAEFAENKYVKLYDFAPAGYFTLSKEGEILQLNVFGAALLGKERSLLLKARFGFFVSEDTKPVFNTFLEKVFYNNVSKFCEVILVRNGKERLTVQLAGAVMENGAKCFVTVSDLTERKYAEEGLRKSEENFRSMFREHSAVMMLVDPRTGNIFDANIAAAKFYGYERSALCSMNISAINLLPEDQVRAERESAVEHRNNYFIFHHKLSDGTVRIVEVHSSPIDHQGKYILFSIIHDITDRIRAEEEILESEGRHKKMIANISDVIGVIGIDGLMKYKSPNIEKWFGWQPHDLIGTDGWLTVHPDDLERIQKEFYTLLQTDNASAKVEYRYKCKDGNYKQIELTAANLVNDPLINGVLLNYRDITIRKKSEEILNNERMRLQGIIEGTNVGTWEWNIQTGEVVFNQKWFEIIGYMPEELSPVSIKTWEVHTHPDDLKKSAILLEQHFKGERLYYTCECRMKHKDGTWVWILDRGRVITRSADGKPLMMFGTHTDISQRKQGEEERERLIAELQSVLAEVKTLTGIIPICAHCKKVRDDKGYWEQVESYVTQHTNAQFSHGICPNCVDKLYPDQAERIRNRSKK